MNSFNYDDIRCVACGSEKITQANSNELEYKCQECNYLYQSAWGVPFFGNYEEEDILGLIEISANVVNRGKFGITPAVVEDWERLLAAYHQATNKADFIKNNPDAQSPYLLNRYGEWEEVTRLTEDLDLQGAKVLDMGAGLGFDSHRLSMRGAKVTGLEFSPVLAESGQLNFPHIRWVGGLSHYLPFKNASFDAVFCNAALHHMRDIPATISEALRVLRPGGVLITTCDSFRPSDSGDEAELDIFYADPAVLLGVNEGVPRFSDFVATLKQFSDFLNVELFTHTLYNAPSVSGIPTISGTTLTQLTPWDLEKDGPMLSMRSGSLAMRIHLKKAWIVPAKIQKNSIVTAHIYASWMSSASEVMAKLASLLPAKYVNLPFPSLRGSKFELLNGWRIPKLYRQVGTAYRRGRWLLSRTNHVFVSWMSSASKAMTKLAALLPTKYVHLPFPSLRGAKFEFLNGQHISKLYRQVGTAYHRGRWFLSRTDAQDTLIFELGLPLNCTSKVESIKVLLNNQEISTHSVSPNGWCQVTLDISQIPENQTFAVEMQQQGGGAALEDASFLVRNRRLIEARKLKTSQVGISAKK